MNLQELRERKTELKEEIRVLEGKPKFSIKQIEREIQLAEIKLDNLERLNRKLRTKTQEQEIVELKELLSKAKLRLLEDKADKHFKASGKRIVTKGLFNQAAQLENIETNPFPTKIVKRRKLVENKLGELVPSGEMEFVEKKLYKEPTYFVNEDGQKVWTIPKGYSKRIASQAKLNTQAKTEKKQIQAKQMLVKQLGRSKVTVIQ